MDIYILQIVTLVCMVVAGSNASTRPAETYWKSVFPNTPMPQAITNSLPLSGKDDVHIDTHKLAGGHVGVDPKKKFVNFTVSLVNWEVSVGFKYNFKASKAQVVDASTRGLFFLEKDMKVGSYKTIKLTKSLNDATFLTRQESNSFPFSSDKMPQILRKFSLKPDSTEAQVVKNTIKACETKGIQGEQKYCATSLESMVDYATSTLGKNIKAISTVVHNNNQVEKYKITGVKKTAREDKNTVCHKENYPFAVFYCHKTTVTSSYLVSFVGPNGSWISAMAVCHKDTSGWNPEHVAFQVLNVKPGTVPICHFLPEDHIVWVPNN